MLSEVWHSITAFKSRYCVSLYSPSIPYACKKERSSSRRDWTWASVTDDLMHDCGLPMSRSFFWLDTKSTCAFAGPCLTNKLYTALSLCVCCVYLGVGGNKQQNPGWAWMASLLGWPPFILSFCGWPRFWASLLGLASGKFDVFTRGSVHKRVSSTEIRLYYYQHLSWSTCLLYQ